MTEILSEIVMGCPIGGIACMDCIEGQCDAIRFGLGEEPFEVHTCSECGAHDAYGSFAHMPSCSASCQTCGGCGEIETGQTSSAKCIDCNGTGSKAPAGTEETSALPSKGSTT